MIYLGADHGGWQLKEKMKHWLLTQGVGIIDLTPDRPRRDDDYPLIAQTVARAVRSQADGQGILFCRSGVGMAIAANKVPDIRAVQGVTTSVARRSRQEEKTNILSLAGDDLTQTETKRIIQTWLNTPFRPVARYRRRLAQLNRLDHGRSIA